MNNTAQSTLAHNSVSPLFICNSPKIQKVRQKVKNDVLVIDNVHYILREAKDSQEGLIGFEKIGVRHIMEHIKSFQALLDSQQQSFIKDIFSQSGKAERQKIFVNYMVHNILQSLDEVHSEAPKVYVSSENDISIYKVAKDNIGSIYSGGKFVGVGDIEGVSQDSEYYLGENEKKLHGYFNSGQRQHRSIHSYDELLLKNIHSPELAGYFKEIHNPITLYFIKKDLGISFGSLTLTEQIKLGNFLSNQDEGIVGTIEKAYKKYGNDFLACFVGLCKDVDMGKALLNYAEYDNMLPMYQHFKKVPSILDSLMKNSKLSQEAAQRFLSTTYGKIKSAFKDFVNPEKGIKADNIHDYYSLPTIIKKSFLSVLLTQKGEKDSFMGIDEFNTLSDTFQIDSFSGGDLLYDDSSVHMQDLNNYREPKKFGRGEYEMLSSNIEKTYGDVDNGWSHVLKRSIPKELQNEDVTFYFIKDKEENKPIACIKSKQLSNGDVYVGSIYVDRRYTGEACIGKYLVNLMYDNNPDGTVYKGLVSAYAQSVQFHTLFATNYFEGITYDTDEYGKSEALFIIDSSAHNKGKFKTERFSGSKIAKLAKESELCTFSEDIEYVVIDGREENKEAFIPFVEKGFKLGYCITRMFHDKKNNEANKCKEINRERTYIVFEKRES